MHKLFFFLLGLSRERKMAIQLVADGTVVILAFVVAMWMRLDGLAFVNDARSWAPVVPAAIALYLVLQIFGFYRAVIRFISIRAMRTVLAGALTSGFVLGLVASLFHAPIPRSVPLMFAILLLLGVGGSRYIFREAIHQSQSRRKERVVIYGAGTAGRQLAQTLLQSNDYLPIAFLDDSVAQQGNMVSGLRIYPPSRIDHLIRNNSISSVLLAIPSATKARRGEILKWLEQFPLHLRTIPGLHDIVEGRARIDDLNEISIEDLLGRDPVPPRADLLGANITDKCVMVTGAGGSIGSELCRQILQQGPRRLVLFELSELALYNIEQELDNIKTHDRLAVEIVPVIGSVQNRPLLDRALRRFGVQTVYHAAAYKHVPLVEQNVAEGVRNNVLGTRTMVEASVAHGVESFILVSTDKAVRPTNIMGASKRLAELICQALSMGSHGNTTISMVRFGNVLGSSGSVISVFRRQIAAGEAITVTHPEITRFFMTIPEAAQLVIQAGAMARGGDVFVLDMGEPVRIAELAARMARLHGYKPVLKLPNTPVASGEIGIVFTHLRPGEKLYEELLIGFDPKATTHPRILTATERHLSLAELSPLLDQLALACDRNDVEQIRRVLVDAQTAYQPQRDVVDNFAPQETGTRPQLPERSGPETKHLTLVRS